MTQTTTQAGRAKLDHPDLLFDTDDGGTALHAALATMFTKISNHLPSRWTGSVTLVDQATTTVTHSFGLALAQMTIVVFEAGVQLTSSQVAARYVITQVDLNSYTIQNISGITKTFDAMTIAYQAVADSSINGVWDTTAGTEWNKSLYVNGPKTISTPAEYENVIIIGDLTLNANLTVRGRLIVIGNVIGNGFKFDCDGDVYILGDVTITGMTSPAMSIGGNLVNITSNANGFVFSNIHLTSGSLTVGGDIVIADATGANIKKLNLKGMSSTGSGNSLIARKSVWASIDTSGASGSAGVGPNGGTVAIDGSLYCGNATVAILTSGANGAATFVSGNAGAVTIQGDLISYNGTISLAGGSGSAANAGNGANLIVYGSILSKSISINGGVMTIDGGNAGNAGSFTCYGHAIVNGQINAYGGYLVASGTGYAAGSAGSITVQNGSLVVEGAINVSGGTYGNTARNSGSIIARNLVASSINAQGGDENGGAGGSIQIDGYCKSHGTSSSTISANGGSIKIAGAPAGAGGTVLINGECTMSISTLGGEVIQGSHAGSGGAITVNGLLFGISLSIDASGGNTTSSSTGNPGAGGTIILYGIMSFGSFIQSFVKSNGGSNNNGSLSGNGSNAGSITINGNAQCGSINAIGGNVAVAGGTGVGGTGGAILIKGNARLTGTLKTSGGNVTVATGGNGGNSGTLEVQGNLAFDNSSSSCLTVSGGDSAGGNGGFAAAVLILGDLTILTPAGNDAFIYRGGDSTKAVGSPIGGYTNTFTVFGDLKITDGNVVFRGGNATDSGVVAGTGGYAGRITIGIAPSFVVHGDIFFGYDGTSMPTVQLKGGNGRTQGGNSCGLKCSGKIYSAVAIDISGGSATDGSGTVGSIGVLHLMGGGFIASVVNSNTGVAESSGTAYFYFSGFVSISSWGVDSTFCPLARYFPRVPVNGSATVTVNKRLASSGLFDPSNTLFFPTDAATSVDGTPPGGSMFGYSIASGVTSWSYDTPDIPLSYLDTDATLAADSDAKVPSQKAVKTLVESKPSLRNQIINGNFSIWQRGTSFASAASAVYAADRWYQYSVAGATASRVAATKSNSSYGLKLARNNAQTWVTANAIAQPFETESIIPLRGKKVTISFWAKAGANYSAASSNMTLKIVTGTGTEGKYTGGSFSGTVELVNVSFPITTTMTKYTHTATVVVPSDATQMEVAFSFTPVGTAGADDSFTIEQVMLNEGILAVPFSMACDTIGNELLLCQRYCWLAGVGPIGMGIASSAQSACLNALIRFPTTMRTNTPTIIVGSPVSSHLLIVRVEDNGENAPTAVAFTTGTTNYRGTNSACVDATGAGAFLTANRQCLLSVKSGGLFGFETEI